MNYETARLRNALPVPNTQYGGGPGKTYDYFDLVALNPPQGATNATIELLYQPTSWEYIQFLDLANNQPPGSFLENEGAYMLEAWLNTEMAEPYVMASATWGDVQSCEAPTPTLESATPGNAQAGLTWSAVDGDGYKVYYDQAGKSQFVADVGSATTYVDSGLSNAQEYCYKVTSYVLDADKNVNCESAFSNILCAIPNNPGQNNIEASLTTGRYETTGKGKNKTITFIATTSFSAGDDVTVIAHVLDEATGLPVPNATVNITITGPESASLSTGLSDANGFAEAVWQTQKPNKRGQGGTTSGRYTAATANVTAAGYSWDEVMSTVAFDLQ